MMFSKKLTRFVAVGAAAVVTAIGAYAIVNSSSGNSASGTAKAAPLAQRGQSNRRAVGQIPQGWHSGAGTIITGATADRVKAVAVAKHPGGTVNRVLKFSDGSYAVHMIKISWPHHVFVSTSFTVTGAIG